MQFWSVRRKQRQCGHISISEHFKKWASLGMTLGKMYEAKILVEAGGGAGTFDLTTATLTAVK
jgi:predicted glycosyltransferase